MAEQIRAILFQLEKQIAEAFEQDHTELDSIAEMNLDATLRRIEEELVFSLLDKNPVTQDFWSPQVITQRVNRIIIEFANKLRAAAAQEMLKK